MGRTWILLTLSLMLPVTVEAGDACAHCLLDAAIDYHDPEGVWESVALDLEIEGTRPGGPPRTTNVEIDLARGIFYFGMERDGRLVEGELTNAECVLRLDGSTEFSAEEAETFRLTCDRLARMRNYYTYLWGLPMKLLDPGTILGDEVEEVDFLGDTVRSIRVTYDPSVGGDVWYFYFDSDQPRLVGYRFFHDEGKGDGEYIVLEGEIEGGGLRVPARRTWYTNAEDELLGTDVLRSIRSLD